MSSTNEPYVPMSHVCQWAIFTDEPHIQTSLLCHPRMSPMYQWAMYTNEPYMQPRLVCHPRMSPIHQRVMFECIPLSHICSLDSYVIHKWALYTNESCSNEPYIPMSHVYQWAMYTNEPYIQPRLVCHPRTSPIYSLLHLEWHFFNLKSQSRI